MLHATIDVFIEQNKGYRAAFRYDTLITDIENKKPNKENLLYIFRKVFSDRLTRVNWEKIKQKKEYQLSEIQASISEKLNLPILKDSFLNKGVYSSLNDFLNNRPSYKAFSVIRTKDADSIQVQDVIIEQASIFGYSDGKAIWIRINDKFFLLHRSGNGFKIFGYNSYVVENHISFGNFAAGLAGEAFRATVLPNSSNQMLSRKNLLITPMYRPFVLDMEKGTIF